MRWKIAVTTAPRHPSFLEQTLESLHAAGWTYKEIEVFAEPGAVDPGVPVAVTRREEKYGPWKNWLHSLRNIASSDCDFVAVIQDDLAFRPGLRNYMDETMSAHGVHSPYLSKTNAKELAGAKNGWHECNPGYDFCGACFFAMSQRLGSDLSRGLPRTTPENKNIDTVVALLFGLLKVPLYLHTPSLVQHLADNYSTMGYEEDPLSRTGYGYLDEPLA